MFDRYPEAGPLYWFKNSKLNKDEIFIYDEKSIFERTKANSKFRL